MNDKESEEIDENLVQDLVGENIVIIIHETGITILMDEDYEDRSVEQMTTFNRMYMCHEPSYVLRFFLFIESLMLLLESMVNRVWDRLTKKS